MIKYFYALLFLGLFSLQSCSKDEEPETPVVLEVKTFKDLHAPQSTDYTTNPPTVSGDFIKFSFSKGSIVTDDAWDIAFRGTSIIINGGEALGSDEPNRTGQAGAYVATGLFDEIKTVAAANFTQDAKTGYAIPKGSGNGWYNYAGPPTHVISPIPGKVLVFKTNDGKHAKMEILSYYKGAPTTPDAMANPSRHYTFKYVYQPKGNTF